MGQLPDVFLKTRKPAFFMNWKLPAALLLGLPLSLLAQVDLINQVEGNGSDSTAPAGYQFETLIDLETTPVKNQGRSGTCWSYATSSFIESELLRKGIAPVDLAEMFTVYHVYKDKARRYVRLHGNLNFGQGGALPDVLYALKHYGAVPQSVYDGLNYGTEINQHSELEALLKAQLDEVIENHNGTLTPNWKKAFTATLDAYLGTPPETFEYQGKTYTPRSFADDYLQIDPDDYVQLTSFTHHPLHEQTHILVPDNWAWAPAYNVALDELIATIDHSLDQGYTVDWATDVSEPGFSLRNGLALVPQGDLEEMSKEERRQVFSVPHPEKEITPALRQKAYDNYSTTDDHAMQITGLVKDREGQEYYIVKNSWGERANDQRPGYIYASKPYTRYKTISIVVHRKAIPRALRKKLDL
jgi:bleomycin hydrolase